MLPRHVANYLSRHKRVTERGIPFILVFAPEATGIYPEHLPDSAGVELPTVAEILSERLRAEGVEVICPSEALRAAKGAVDLYLQLDSHWSFSGAYLCYRQIVAALQQNLPVKEVAWQHISYGSRNGYGDLGVHTRPERKGPIQTVDIAGYEVTTSSTIYDQREKNFRQTTCPMGVGKALVFRDSYANALSPFLERTFAETTLIAPAPTMLDSAIDLYAPDVVILEVAERALYQEEFAFSDWDARTFEQNYFERLENPVGGKLQTESLTYIGAGQPAEAIPALAVAVALEGENARVHNLAWALLNMGNSPLCRTLSAAFAAKTDNRFLHYLHSQAAYNCNLQEEALAALDRAIAQQPKNALYHYSRAEWLYRLNRHEETIASALISVSYAPLHERSWSLLGGALQKTGRAKEAEAYYQQADHIFGGAGFDRTPP